MAVLKSEPLRSSANQMSYFDTDAYQSFTGLFSYTYSLNPNQNDANLDFDSDGYSNLSEYEADTNPADSNDMPLSGGGVWKYAIPLLLK